MPGAAANGRLPRNGPIPAPSQHHIGRTPAEMIDENISQHRTGEGHQTRAAEDHGEGKTPAREEQAGDRGNPDRRRYEQAARGDE